MSDHRRVRLTLAPAPAWRPGAPVPALRDASVTPMFLTGAGEYGPALFARVLDGHPLDPRLVCVRRSPPGKRPIWEPAVGGVYRTERAAIAAIAAAAFENDPERIALWLAEGVPFVVRAPAAWIPGGWCGVHQEPCEWCAPGMWLARRRRRNPPAPRGVDTHGEKEPDRRPPRCSLRWVHLRSS